MKYLLYLILGLLFGGLQYSYAQVDYRPGYVVSLRGDTVDGFIDYRNWEKSPNIILFRSTPEGTDQRYTPLDIRAFYVSGDLYESAIVQVETSPVQEDDLGYDAELQLRRDTAFVATLIAGEKSLYIYHVKGLAGRKKQFYIRKNGQLELLIFKSYLQHADGKRVIARNTFYLNQLALYLQDCPSVQKNLRNLRYSNSSLERLFRQYYACVPQKAAFEVKKEKMPLEIGVLVGASQAGITFQTNNARVARELTQASFSDNIRFTGGMFFDLVLPRNKRKFSINNELVYATYKLEATEYTVYVDENRYDYAYTKLAYSYLKLNTMFRFKYPLGQCYLFANGGMSNGYALRQQDYQRSVSKLSNPTPYVHEGTPFANGSRRYEQAFFGGIGVRHGRYSFETRYERGNGMLNEMGLSSKTTRLYCLLAYRFTQ